MFQRIMVAIDPTAARHTALRTAHGLARLSGARVHVLHVATSAVAYNAVMPLEDDAEAKAILAEALAEVRKDGVEADGALATGLVQQVPETITEEAEKFGADLLVLSPHHRGSLAALFNPRISDAIAHRVGIAVLLAPEDPEAAESTENGGSAGAAAGDAG
ncbi:universal stress protein [Streptomyces sp. NPDC088354]|uniref:universal stress protein n=1 Tax=unclassified Streptomyces TaxID=2593676 RepID=UPI0029A5A885|nr:universal stress protein [Streptomyces sp. MI02-7b]MDX3070905.1 universal stress protein [Streptomyces sp. MI02-7b]